MANKLMTLGNATAGNAIMLCGYYVVPLLGRVNGLAVRRYSSFYSPHWTWGIVPSHDKGTVLCRQPTRHAAGTPVPRRYARFDGDIRCVPSQ